MSNRDSMGFGDLIPQDVVDIFAQEKHDNGRKKRTRSLGRALGWLKGKKRKGLDAKGQGLGLGPALDLALDGHPAGHQGGHKGGQKSGKQAHPQGNGHAVPKRDDDDKTTAPPLLQENVFIEASPTQYLENLHTEAREGLKMMQQEETNYGVEFQDNESTVSTMSVHTDGEGFMSDSTLADTTSVVSVQSSVSTRSSRSGLTRQESTFRPLTSGKKTKTKRRHRKTVGGIPQHVQRELGLDRAAWSVTQKFDEEQLYNGDTENSPTTTDGPQQGAGTSLQKRNAFHPLNKDQLDQLSASHRDDLHHLGTDLSDEQRSQSMVVPWMNTAEGLPSPVISMSPQAPYMSKIIPNAVLRPSIDVVEISRGRSRNSVRTVSKSSLVLSSPSPSRASSRASSSRTTSSRSSHITSASRQNPPNVSDSSCWSNSDSSETLVSDSSTISRSSTPRQKKLQDGDVSAKEDKISVHSSNSKASNGRLVVKGDEAKKDGPFGRSLSVMKSKKAPPPPSRSYSLHNKTKRRSRDLTEVRVNSGEENEKNKPGSSPVPSKAIDSPGYHADTSSLDDSAGSGSFSPIRSQQQAQKAEGAVSKEKQKPHQENKLSKTVSPSSGYSSQDGTSTQVSKQPHKRGILAKLQRLFPGSAPAASTLSPLPQPKDLKPDTAVDTVDTVNTVNTVNVSPSVRALRELFNIPPPPKVHAPPPPPPEVWAHSKRSVELLLGPPAPDNLQAIIKKNPKDRRQQRQSPSASTEGSVKSLVVERKHNNPAVTVESVNGSVHVLETKKVQESVILSDGLAEQNVDLKGNSEVTEKVEKVKVSNIISVMLAKAVERREGRLEAVREEEEVKKASIQAPEVTLPAISLVRMPPSPSPALVHHPPQQTTSPESSWPPPPPPMAQVGVNGTDGNDLPLPPPPMFGEVGLVLPVQVPPESSVPGGDSSCTATSVTSVVKIEAEPLNIPPPPPYMAPPPPAKAVSPPTTKKVPPPPPPKEVSPPPPPKKVSLPSLIVVPPPPPKDVSPLPPRKEVFPPPPIVVSPPPPPKEVSPPPPTVVSPPPPPKEVSPPPPDEIPPSPPKEVSPPPPTVVSPPPPPKEVSPPPPDEIPPPPPKEIPPSPPKEVSPPPPEEIPPSPPKEVSPVRPKESSPLVNDISVTLVTVVSPPPVKEVSPPLVIEVTPLPPKEVSALSTEEVSPPSSQENACQSSEEATPVSQFAPPQSIPPPPPLSSQPKSSEQEIDPPQESIPPESESNLTSDSIVAPPQSIPPPPPVQLVLQPQVVPQTTDGPASQEPSPSPPSEVSIPPALENSLTPEKAQEPAPLPPPLPVQGVADIKDQPSPASTENQTLEQTSVPVVQEEPTPTPTLLQMVMLRSVKSSPEPPKAQDPPEAEVTMRKQQPSNLKVSTTSANGEVPQKPIRRSLILLSPTSPTSTSPPPTSPPATVTALPTLPMSQSVLVLPSSPVASPTKKSPPAMTASPSMNLQEAIRLRTAARSKAGPPTRLSLHSPTSPIDLHKSPSSTASFIFSKSNKRVVIETKPAPETVEKKLEVSPVTKVASEAEWVKKMPPPVAKKPKKGKEIETSEGTEQTAGQEALQESIMDAAEKTNGTAGTVEGGAAPST